MGRSYLFECSKCAYKAAVSGGSDDGVDCSVRTVICRDCRKLYDAVVRLRVITNGGGFNGGSRRPKTPDQPPLFEEIIKQLPLPAASPFQWAAFPLRCPVSSKHAVQRWSDPGKCPVCGAFLEKGGLPFRLWS